MILLRGYSHVPNLWRERPAPKMLAMASSNLQSRDPGTNPAPPALRRTLGPFDGIAILIGITIGAGIYSTPQIISEYQSSFAIILFLWVLAGCFAFVGSLVYAELGTRLPNTGGEYVYINRCFGPFAGFVFGWAQLFIIRTSPAAGLAIVTANYLEYFIPLSGRQHLLVSLLVIFLLGALNYVGVARAAIFQKASTILKLGGLLLLILAGLVLAGGTPESGGNPFQPTTDPVTSFVAAMMLIVFSYMGWDRVGYVAGEMKNPQKVVPISMLAGMSAIVLTYIGANWFYVHTLGLDGVRGATIVASDAAVGILGPIGAGLVALLVIVSATGSINGTMMTAPRAYFAMARDGLFFRWLNFVHPTYRTPSRAIVVHCLWAVVILLVRQNFETIVAGMAFAVLIFYAMTALALFKLRWEGIGDAGSYRVPLFPILPGIYLVGIVLLVVLRLIFEFEKSLADLAFIATGIPFAFWFCRKKS